MTQKGGQASIPLIIRNYTIGVSACTAIRWRMTDVIWESRSVSGRVTEQVVYRQDELNVDVKSSSDSYSYRTVSKTKTS